MHYCITNLCTNAAYALMHRFMGLALIDMTEKRDATGECGRMVMTSDLGLLNGEKTHATIHCERR